MESGGCYNFWALDGSDPPESYLQVVLGDQADWRDAYTVEFDKEQET